MTTPTSTNLSTEAIQRLLDENQHLILAVMENKNLGRIPEATQFQSKLQQNLISLATIADQQPMRIAQGVAAPMPSSTTTKQADASIAPQPVESAPMIAPKFHTQPSSTAQKQLVPSRMPLPTPPAQDQNAFLLPGTAGEEDRETRKWTEQEEAKLREALEFYSRDGNRTNLKALASYVGTRTPMQVRAYLSKQVARQKGPPAKTTPGGFVQGSSPQPGQRVAPAQGPPRFASPSGRGIAPYPSGPSTSQVLGGQSPQHLLAGQSTVQFLPDHSAPQLIATPQPQLTPVTPARQLRPDPGHASPSQGGFERSNE